MGSHGERAFQPCGPMAGLWFGDEMSLQAHSLNTCSPSWWHYFEAVEPLGYEASPVEVGQRGRPLKWIAHRRFWPYSLLPGLP